MTLFMHALSCWRRLPGDMRYTEMRYGLLLRQGKPDQARDVLKQGLGSENPSGADAGR